MSIFSDFFKQPFDCSLRDWLVGILVSSISTLIVFCLLFLYYYQHRIYQGIYINHTNVGGLTKEQALAAVQPPDVGEFGGTAIITTPDREHQISLSSLITGWNQQEMVDQALQIGHQQPPLAELKTIFELLITEKNLSLSPSIDRQLLQTELEQFKNQADQPSSPPSIELAASGDINSLVIDPGKNGRSLQIEATADKIAAAVKENFSSNTLTSGSPSTPRQAELSVSAVIEPVEVELTELQQASLKERAASIIGQQITFTANLREAQDDRYTQARSLSFTLNDQKIIALFDPAGGYQTNKIAELVESWAQQIDRPAQNAVFKYDPQTLVVSEFVPPQKGLGLDQQQAQALAVDGLNQLEKKAKNPGQTQEQAASDQPSQSGQDNQIDLPISQTDPDTTLAETNDLGINTLIGLGDSYYAHSIPARIHNVSITADKLSLNIVPPGEKFSFNQAIGEVSSHTGYRPAYVIKGGRTVLGEGGGVCQVSTTLFRALLDAGVDITKRLPHSYRVSYYELDKKPGFDATAYAGDIDLRFINDTPNHILIYSTADSEDLYMKVEIYGTDDGRTTQISNYKKWDYSPPPPPEYIPSTDISPGQTKQIDWAVSGIKTSFDWTVRDKNGQIIRQKTYYSSYRPWSAKYLQGVESLPQQQ